MANFWYVLRTKPRKEEIVYKQVLGQGVTVYYPRLRVQPVNPRSRKIKPYFPGYMFIQTNIEATGTSIFQWMPHTFGLVNFGNEPAIVPDNLIHEIKKKVEALAAETSKVSETFKSGDVIRVNNGVFVGYEAIFDENVSGKERVRVLLKLLNDQRFVRIELETKHITHIE